MIIPLELDDNDGRTTALFLKEPRKAIDVYDSIYCLIVGAFIWHGFAEFNYADETIQLTDKGREFLNEVEAMPHA